MAAVAGYAGHVPGLVALQLLYAVFWESKTKRTNDNCRKGSIFIHFLGFSLRRNFFLTACAMKCCCHELACCLLLSCCGNERSATHSQQAAKTGFGTRLCLTKCAIWHCVTYTIFWQFWIPLNIHPMPRQACRQCGRLDQLEELIWVVWWRCQLDVFSWMWWVHLCRKY